MYRFSLSLLLVAGVTFVACGQPPVTEETHSRAVVPAQADSLAEAAAPDSANARVVSAMDAAFLRGFPYRLSRPVAEFQLPNRLEEVSGIAWLADGLIAMIEDEDGDIFLWDERQEGIEATHTFARAGDYEGLVVKDEQAFVLTSEGVIYQVQRYADKRKQKVRSYPSGLTVSDDCEGLTLDPSGKKLLILPKENTRNTAPNLRTIYAWNIAKHQPELKPWLTFDLNEVRDELGRDGKTFFPDEPKSFKPSDLAIHPQTGDIYVLASVGKLLVVLKPNGKVRYAIPLDEKEFRQPEGLTFSPKGQLYISSEGAGKKAKLWRFDPR